MIFPLQELIEFQDNIYEITCASTRRAFQLVVTQDPVLKKNNDKVVSTAASQIFTGVVDYKIEYHPEYS
ncbi:MAG: DNA-directed RNA polymerase subunit omega [Treponema sp.]